MLGITSRNVLLRIPVVRRTISSSVPVCSPIVVRMPALSPTMTEGNIVAWAKKEGDEITAGDSLCDIQTDKAVMTMETEEEGFLAKILRPEGTEGVAVGQPIALIAEEGEDWKTVTFEEEGAPEGQAATDKSSSTSKMRRSRDAEFPPLRDLATLKIGPAVRLLLELYNVHPEEIEITGPHHRVLKGDVLAHIAAHGLKPQPPKAAPPPSMAATPDIPIVEAKPPKAAPPPTAAPPKAPPAAPAEGLSFIDVAPTASESAAAEMSSVAKRGIPHNYVSVDVKMDHVMRVAERAKLPVGPFILKAAAVAVHAVPEVNAVLGEDGVTVAPNPVIDMAVVSSVHPNSAPCIIRSVDRMTCADIAKILETPAEKEASPQLGSAATFSLVDLTDSSVAHLAAIVCPPHVAVLAIGGVRASLKSISGSSKVIQKATATLSVDTRAVDETVAAHFLAAFSSALEMAVVAVPASGTITSSADPFDDLFGLDLD